MRRALSHEIGRPKHTIGTRAHGGCFASEFVVRKNGGILQEISNPPKRQPRSLCNSHDVPATGNCVAESMNTAFDVESWRVGGGKDHAGSSYRRAHRSSADDAHADGAASLVSGSSNNRNVGRKSSVC